MSELQRTIDTVIGESLHPALKAKGFRKKGRTFLRDNDNRTDVISIRTSPHDYDLNGSFTIVLGVYYEELARLLGTGPPKSGSPRVRDCVLTTNIGQLMPQRMEHWWEILLGEDTHKTAIDVSEAVRTFGLPWFEDITDIDRLREMLMLRDSLLAASACSLMLGQRQEAARIIQQAMAEHQHEAQVFSSWAEKHSLL